jgi:PleD family two-component response regulator
MNAVGNNWIDAGSEKVHVTISMGVVTESSLDLSFDDPKEYLRELFATVDSALYKAKNEGRNRVVMAR